jgi:succinate dehydrogenase subunit C
MSDIYTEYHPRWLRTRVSTYWWLQRRSYLAFIMRELSSVFVAWFVVYLLRVIHAIAQGPAAYEQVLRWSAQPAVLLINLVTLLFVVFHAVTWFNLAPQAIVPRVGGKRLPASVITASNYAAWIVISAVVGWLLLGA